MRQQAACPAAEADDEWEARLTSASIVAILSLMLETRTATAADAQLISHHRQRMFIDAGRVDDQVLGEGHISTQIHRPAEYPHHRQSAIR